MPEVLGAAGRWLGRYLDALSFLSRLPARPGQTEARFIAGLPAFAAAGLTLGIVWALCGLAALQYARMAGLSSPLAEVLAGWIWLLALLWTTRGLHWDGVADLADACGSGARGERFWQILRDSRLGAFGGMALCAGFGGAALLAAAHAGKGQWLCLVLAPAWARSCSLMLAAAAPAQGGGNLGRLVCAAMTPRLVRAQQAHLAAILLLLWLTGLPLVQAALLAAGQYGLHCRLRQVALARGGLSGDFLGAGIETAQLWFLLAVL